MTEEQKKAFGERMKKAREAKKGGTPPVEKPKKEEKEEVITISKSDFKSLKDDMKQLKKDNNLLMATADKKAMAHYYDRNKADLPDIVKLRTFDGKLILSWRTVKNDVFQVPGTGAWKEDQVIELSFDDDTKIEVPLVNFYRKYDYISAKVVGTETDEINKGLSLKVVREDTGENITIGVQFVN